jgi:hypothetical protein
MKVFKPAGSKERLFEMFENVNKIKINESFDNPEEKDEKYLDKAGDQDAEEVQPNKYDDGVRYPVEPELKVDDESLEGLKGDDAPLDESEDHGDVNQEVYDELEMRYSHSTQSVPFSEFDEVAEMYGMDTEDVLAIYQDLLGDMAIAEHKEIENLLAAMIDEHDLDIYKIQQTPFEEIYALMDELFDMREYNKEVVKDVFDSFKNDPSQLKLFENEIDEIVESLISESNKLDEFSPAYSAGLRGAVSGLKGIGKGIFGRVASKVVSVVDKVGDQLQAAGAEIAKDYQAGQKEKYEKILQDVADRFAEDFGKMVAKINAKAQQLGQEPIKPRSFIMGMANKITTQMDKEANPTKYAKKEIDKGELKSYQQDGKEVIELADDIVKRKKEGRLSDEKAKDAFFKLYKGQALSHSKWSEYYRKLSESENKKGLLLSPELLYTPKKLEEAFGPDPEVGEEEHEEKDKVQNYLNLEKLSRELAELRDRDPETLKQMIKDLKEVPMVWYGTGDHKEGLFDDDLVELGILEKRRSHVDPDWDHITNITSDKDIIFLDTKRNIAYEGLKAGEDDHL